MTEQTLNAALSLFMLACLIPLSSVFFSLYWAGLKLTLPENRTDLGNWLGRFSLSVGLFLFAIGALVANRWLDLSPDVEYTTIATFSRILGVGALLGALVSAHFVLPLLLMRIREGRI